MAEQENDTLSTIANEIWNLPHLIRALYYSDDFQTRVCWWCVYTLVVLVVLIHMAWRLYGSEIANNFNMQQGRQFTPAGQRSQENKSKDQHSKVD